MSLPWRRMASGRRRRSTGRDVLPARSRFRALPAREGRGADHQRVRPRAQGRRAPRPDFADRQRPRAEVADPSRSIGFPPVPPRRPARSRSRRDVIRHLCCADDGPSRQHHKDARRERTDRGAREQHRAGSFVEQRRRHAAEQHPRTRLVPCGPTATSVASDRLSSSSKLGAGACEQVRAAWVDSVDGLREAPLADASSSPSTWVAA